jgi:hypothetical protein
MRVPPDRRSNKASKKSAASERPVEVQRADLRAVIEAELEKNPFHKGNTAGGRTPPYKPEYAVQAKALCERGATTDELSEALGVSPKIVGMWLLVHDDFREACKLTPACTDRVKRKIFESAAAGNFAAAKFWDENHESEGVDTFALFLKELSDSHESRVQPRFTGPDRMMMSKAEQIALVGHAEADNDWRNKTPEEASQFKERLLELRRRS